MLVQKSHVVNTKTAVFFAGSERSGIAPNVKPEGRKGDQVENAMSHPAAVFFAVPGVEFHRQWHLYEFFVVRVSFSPTERPNYKDRTSITPLRESSHFVLPVLVVCVCTVSVNLIASRHREGDSLTVN